MLPPMAESADLQPWPRVGETWAPALPWPREECPAGFYTFSYSTVLVGGRSGCVNGLRSSFTLNANLTPSSPSVWIICPLSPPVPYLKSQSPKTHPEQIGRLPPADRLRTSEACVAAAWDHYRANGGST